MDDNTWKDIPGLGGWYQASTDGWVRSVDRAIIEKTGKVRPCKGRVLTRFLHQGYWAVNISYSGQQKHQLIHRLVMLTFVGPCPAGMEINHKNGVRTDASLDNLEYVTRSQNMRHAIDVLHTHWSPFSNRRGEDCYSAKLTTAQVIEIKALIRARQITYRQIAEIYGVSTPAIGLIASGVNWKWCEAPNETT